ncbi:6-phosphogluconate dehydrogenase (decarboxylating) [Rhinocladiella mackenziei CBS 650.93]|uniref:phosphogluconate dehydrogenase (NADP(+)-dependent, decarboxylating) n=1 Tax=Rhinocladiella mackenziei CBS 650.93 TaxID=1442369 RepID=A0A0D2IG51_9EURO|nr:6-phosphogluconate dehydrogenase (decarboxylating) [Rhinocladiella mackenziei CBS 650.93]KIX02251.1 6-phosphogluconate dehydrogenase (decarboxylating) [Rhinocladiella mackenziei CBS 650.93]
MSSTDSKRQNEKVRGFPFNLVGIVGAGSMGSMMALGLSETGVDIAIWDISPNNVKQALSKKANTESSAEASTRNGEVYGFTEISDFAESLSKEPNKVLIFSITHGQPADQVLDQLEKYLKPGDIILDGGNEHYRNTERRQRALFQRGVSWIGMGVSGGYQSARKGPSLSPGGDQKAIDKVLPLLKQFAAKAETLGHVGGAPCIEYIGPHGSGHFVKMLHNGIENGMLSSLCEAWGMMKSGLDMTYEDIGNALDQWDRKGELRSNFLLQIGSEICHRKKTLDGDGHGEGKGREGYVLDDVLDKVVQDDDNSEGTGFWSVMEAAARHVAAPTIAAGQFFRVASGNRAERLEVAKPLQTPTPSKANSDIIQNRDDCVEDIRRAVYASFLCAFCQGLEIISRASHDEGWDVSLSTCIRIWRGGCIIQSNHIADILEADLGATDEKAVMNVKLLKQVSAALRDNYGPLKRTVARATEWNAHIPSLSASLEYIKYCGGTSLPTRFMEAQMDFFGAHAFDRPGVKDEDPGKPSKGACHYEWRPA